MSSFGTVNTATKYNFRQLLRFENIYLNWLLKMHFSRHILQTFQTIKVYRGKTEDAETEFVDATAKPTNPFRPKIENFQFFSINTFPPSARWIYIKRAIDPARRSSSFFLFLSFFFFFFVSQTPLSAKKKREKHAAKDISFGSFIKRAYSVCVMFAIELFVFAI